MQSDMFSLLKGSLTLFEHLGGEGLFLAETELKSYRNYSSVHITWHRGINILLGCNAQGKTNLLESIYVLSFAKSHRTTKDKEWIRFDDPFAVIKGIVLRKNGPISLEITVTDRGKKAKINSLEQKRLSDFIGTLNVVMFAPEDLELVKGAPGNRRRFLDMEIGQVSPAYLYNLNSYNKILMQRNQLLKEIAQREKKANLLEIWDEQLVEYGVKILHKRLDFMKKLSMWAKEIHSTITNKKEELYIEYQSSLQFVDQLEFHQLSHDQIRDLYLEQLRKARDKEIARGMSLIGPHRDDLAFFINQQNVQSYGSQGQQRTTALSLKLAEIELIHQEVGEYPILLLDDVFSELDENRQNDLIRSIKDKCQTFITTTSIDAIPEETIDEAKIYRVHAGSIVEDKIKEV